MFCFYMFRCIADVLHDTHSLILQKYTKIPYKFSYL